MGEQFPTPEGKTERDPSITSEIIGDELEELMVNLRRMVRDGVITQDDLNDAEEQGVGDVAMTLESIWGVVREAFHHLDPVAIDQKIAELMKKYDLFDEAVSTQ